jgi:hypothetical protein
VTPSEKLDRHLAAAIDEGRAITAFVNKIHGVKMPELGGKSLADQVRVGLGGLRKQLDELKIDTAGALTELSTEIANGKEGVKRIREETAAVKSAFGEILGNESVSDQKVEP